ncbi:ABC transporter substrate-binding protein [Azospira sp. I13]|uniref:MlaD family protein n=1 Tax=Azospira sp. I13 TaxID=1765050 RepID=UPI000D4E202F|nr:MlaD family protein [Azospira sp. I13]GBG02678.1 ABC transporter substrate-binding protein [Azospira sp. I13]
MENRAHALAAGVFTLLLVAAALFAVWWFGGKHELTRDYLVVTQGNVTGLNVQAQVRYRGIRVGRVEEIHLDKARPDDILIRISILDEVPVNRSTIAILNYQGVTGLAQVQLEERGDDERPLDTPKDQLPRIPMQPSLIQELSDAGADTLRQARDLLTSANKLLGDDNQRRIGNTLANLEEVSTGLKPAARELGPTLAQLRKALSEDNVKRLSATLEGGAEATREAKELLAGLRRLSERLEHAGAGEGGPGLLSPRWGELATDVAASTRQLNRVLEQVEREPQSLIFGAPAPAPGPGEPGFIPRSGRSQ